MSTPLGPCGAHKCECREFKPVKGEHWTICKTCTHSEPSHRRQT